MEEWSKNGWWCLNKILILFLTFPNSHSNLTICYTAPWIVKEQWPWICLFSIRIHRLRDALDSPQLQHIHIRLFPKHSPSSPSINCWNPTIALSSSLFSVLSSHHRPATALDIPIHILCPILYTIHQQCISHMAPFSLSSTRRRRRRLHQMDGIP